MKRLKGRLYIAAIFVAVFTFASVITVIAAEVVIDVFSDTLQEIDYRISESDTFPISLSDFANTSGGEALGGQRDLCLEVVGGNTNGDASTMVDNFNDYWQLALDPSVRAIVSLQWDGSETTCSVDRDGLGSIDLTDGGTNEGILMRVISSDGLPVDIAMRIYSGENDWAEQTVRFDSTVNQGDTVDLFMLFDDFVDQEGAMQEDSVGAVELELDGTIQAGADMTIKFVKATSLYDFGDLPSGYPVTSLESGPQHKTGQLRLGANVDAEADGSHSLMADHDDTDAFPGDEDGVTRQPSLTGGSTHGGWTNGTVDSFNGGSLEISITGGSGYPQVFVDFGSGLTEVSLEDMFGNPLSMPLTEGTHQVYFDVPGGTFNGSSNTSIPVRVRLSSSGGLGVSGPADDGEVEDYIWGFGPNAVTLSQLGTLSYALAPFALGFVAIGAVVIVRRRRTDN